ncbi:MAG: PQQ-binding-like beta-propeller repeat protein [Planctomycetota bacterium]|nr:PQQ-binding-like beta-propeller repeat protein [Planctomycetota bacterium]
MSTTPSALPRLQQSTTLSLCSSALQFSPILPHLFLLFSLCLLFTGCDIYTKVDDPGPGEPKAVKRLTEDKISDSLKPTDGEYGNSEAGKGDTGLGFGKGDKGERPKPSDNGTVADQFGDVGGPTFFGFHKSDPIEANIMASPLARAGMAQAADWPMHQGGPRHTGHSGDRVVGVPLLLKWRKSIGCQFSSSPVIADGRIYGVCADGLAAALDFASGQKLWQTQLDSTVLGAPAVAGGLLLVPGVDGNLYALDIRNGLQIKKFRTFPPDRAGAKSLGTSKPSILANAVLFDDHVFYAGHDGRLYELDVRTKNVVRVTPLPGPVRTGGFAVYGENVVATSVTGELATIRLGHQAHVLWRSMVSRPSADAFRITPVITGNVLLSATGQDSLVQARSLSKGSPLWGRPVEGLVTGMGTDGARAFVTSFDKNRAFLSAIDIKSGQPEWRASLKGKSLSPPVVANGFVYVGLSGGENSLLAFEAASGRQLWHARHFSSISNAPVPYAGHLIVATDSGYIASYEPSDILADNRFLKSNAPPKPYLDWIGTVDKFEWRISKWPKGPARFNYRMTDFSFRFQPLDDASPWTVVSKAMVPYEPYLLSPTYTGLDFPRGNDVIRVIGVRGIDRRSRLQTKFEPGAAYRVLTALIVARKIGNEWRPVYVNNWLTSWRENLPAAADSAIAGYYVNKGRPFDVYMPLDDAPTRRILTTFDRMLVVQAPDQSIARGQLRTDAQGETRMHVTHYWGSRVNRYDPKLIYGDKNLLNFLELYR